jgi:hypothetical protein
MDEKHRRRRRLLASQVQSTGGGAMESVEAVESVDFNQIPETTRFFGV